MKFTSCNLSLNKYLWIKYRPELTLGAGDAGDERKKDRINKEAIVEERKALYTKGITQSMMMVERRRVTQLSRRDGVSAVVLKDEWESDRRGKAVHEERPIT